MRLTLLPLLLLVACDGFKNQGDDSAQSDLYDPGHCQYTPTAVAFDVEDAVVGFSPFYFSTVVEGERSALLVWDESGAQSELSYSIVLDHDSFQRMDGVWIPPEGNGGMEYDTMVPDSGETACPSYLAAQGVYHIVTADGHLNESIQVSISATAPDAGSVHASVAYGDLAGSYAPSEINPSEWDEVRLDFAQSFGAAEAGQLVLFASRVEESEGEDGVAMAMQSVVAHWPAQ